MIIDINIFMDRKTHHSVERCHPKHTHQPHIIITNHVHPPHPPPPMTILNTHVQHYKPSNYLQPPKALPGALSKSMVFMQQGHPSRAGQEPKAVLEQAKQNFLPSPLRGKNPLYHPNEPKPQPCENVLKRSEMMPACRLQTSISSIQGINSPHLPQRKVVFAHGTESSSGENQLSLCQLTRPDKKLFQSVIMEQHENKTKSLSPFSKETHKELASTAQSDQASSIFPSKIKRVSIWPINVTPLENKTCDHEELTFRKQDEEQQLEQCEFKIRVFQAKNRMSAPLPKKAEWKLEDFEIVEKIGKGAYGDVFLAQEKKTCFLCVIKTISKQRIKDKNLEQHILREIKIQMYMNHRHLTSLYGFFDDENKIYLIMEYLSDGNLSHVYRKKKIPEDKVSKIVRQVCQGLHYLHKQDTIHRDIKPENLFIHEDYVKIGDFGCAIFSNTLRKTVVGCLAYISPEQLANGFYDDKIDVWSVGILTFQLLTGKPPFEQDIIKIAQHQQEPKLSELNFPSNVQISPDAMDFIQSMLKEQPSDRLDMRDALKHPFLTKYRETENSN